MMTPSDAQLREFLLRRMPSHDAARLEEAIVVTDGAAERLRDEEFDLIDDYAAGRLMAEDRADAERYLLTSLENIHSLRISRSLSRESASRQPALLVPGTPVPGTTQVQGEQRRRWMVRLAPMGVVLAAGLVAIALIPDWSRTSGQPGVTSTAARSEAPSALPSRAPKAADSIPIVTLFADVNRGSTTPVLHWRADAGSIRLQAEVPGPDRNTLYLLRVYDAAGRSLFEAAALSAHTAGHYRFVDTVLPSKVLGPGARSVSLWAADSAEGTAPDYTWHVLGALD
jgi:hypothetical protein